MLSLEFKVEKDEGETVSVLPEPICTGEHCFQPPPQPSPTLTCSICRDERLDREAPPEASLGQEEDISGGPYRSRRKGGSDRPED